MTGDCANSITDAIADLQAGGITPDAASLNIAGCALAGGTVTCNGTGFPANNTQGTTVTNGFPNDVKVYNAIGKVDVNLSQNSRLSGTYFFGNNTGTVEDFPELQSKWRSDIHTRAQVVGGSWVWTPSPRWVNEARVGYSRLYQPTLPGDLNTPASAYGLNTGVSGAFTGGLPRIGFGGVFTGLGAFKWPKFQGPDSITQFVDHISYTAGNHSIKFGGDLHRNQVTNAAYGNARGSITFLGGYCPALLPRLKISSLACRLNRQWKSAILRCNFTTGLFGFFAQDDWRATKRLTLNFGLRYEYSTVVQEAHNLLGNFDPNVGLVQVSTGTNRISSLYKPDHYKFRSPIRLCLGHKRQRLDRGSRWRWHGL